MQTGDPSEKIGKALGVLGELRGKLVPGDDSGILELLVSDVLDVYQSKNNKKGGLHTLSITGDSFRSVGGLQNAFKCGVTIGQFLGDSQSDFFRLGLELGAKLLGFLKKLTCLGFAELRKECGGVRQKFLNYTFQGRNVMLGFRSELGLQSLREGLGNRRFQSFNQRIGSGGSRSSVVDVKIARRSGGIVGKNCNKLIQFKNQGLILVHTHGCPACTTTATQSETTLIGRVGAIRVFVARLTIAAYRPDTEGPSTTAMMHIFVIRRVNLVIEYIAVIVFFSLSPSLGGRATVRPRGLSGSSSFLRKRATNNQSEEEGQQHLSNF
jgi:hypothetical protein